MRAVYINDAYINNISIFTDILKRRDYTDLFIVDHTYKIPTKVLKYATLCPDLNVWQWTSFRGHLLDEPTHITYQFTNELGEAFYRIPCPLDEAYWAYSFKERALNLGAYQEGVPNIKGFITDYESYIPKANPWKEKCYCNNPLHKVSNSFRPILDKLVWEVKNTYPNLELAFCPYYKKNRDAAFFRAYGRGNTFLSESTYDERFVNATTSKLKMLWCKLKYNNENKWLAGIWPRKHTKASYKWAKYVFGKSLFMSDGFWIYLEDDKDVLDFMRWEG